MVLSTDVETGDPNHAGLHNEERAAINALNRDTGWRRVNNFDLDIDSAIEYSYRRVGNDVEIVFHTTFSDEAYIANAIIKGLRPSMPHSVSYGFAQFTVPYAMANGDLNALFFETLDTPGDEDKPCNLGCSFGATFNHGSDIFVKYNTRDEFLTAWPGNLLPDPF